MRVPTNNKYRSTFPKQKSIGAQLAEWFKVITAPEPDHGQIAAALIAQTGHNYGGFSFVLPGTQIISAAREGKQ